jgi:hypothetical protein
MKTLKQIREQAKITMPGIVKTKGHIVRGFVAPVIPDKAKKQ